VTCAGYPGSYRWWYSAPGRSFPCDEPFILAALADPSAGWARGVCLRECDVRSARSAGDYKGGNDKFGSHDQVSGLQFDTKHGLAFRSCVPRNQRGRSSSFGDGPDQGVKSCSTRFPCGRCRAGHWATPLVQIPPDKAITAKFLVSNPAVMIGVLPCRYGCSLAYFQPEKDRFNFLIERLKKARDEKSHIHFRSKRNAWISVRRNDSGPAAAEGIRQALALATVRSGRYRRAACLRSGACPRRNERGIRRALSEALNLQEAAVEGGLSSFRCYLSHHHQSACALRQSAWRCWFRPIRMPKRTQAFRSPFSQS
jgi:hypothetical protein